jgi:glycosyltransferase 2 family protein
MGSIAGRLLSFVATSVSHTRTTGYKSLARSALFVIGLLFFLALLVRSWHEIGGLLQTLNAKIFLLSLLVALVDNVLFSVLFQSLLGKYGFHVDYPRIAQMYFYGQIAKYIPGRFWGVLYHAAFLQQRGATSGVLFANLDLMVVVILRNITLAAAIILFYRQAWLISMVLIIGSLGFWYLSRSCWIASTARFASSRAGYFAVSFSSCAPCSDHRKILTINVATSITYITANLLLLKAVFDLPVQESAIYVAYFSLAWIAGVLSIIVPAGIGIREITFIMLAHYMGQGQSATVEFLAAIAVVYRFWHTLLELSGVGLGFVLRYVRSMS